MCDLSAFFSFKEKIIFNM